MQILCTVTKATQQSEGRFVTKLSEKLSTTGGDFKEMMHLSTIFFISAAYSLLSV
jgi:hypothetical protein